MVFQGTVLPPAAPRSGSFASPTPFAAVLPLLTLALMMLQRFLHAKRRPPSMSPSDDPSGKGTEELPREEVDRLDPEKPVAVFLVGGDNDLGPPALRLFGALFAKEYPQILFTSVGVMDYRVVDAGVEGTGDFKGHEEVKRLKRKTRLALDPYLESVHQLGLKADCRISIATDVVREIDTLSNEIGARYPRAVFFVSKLVFRKPHWFKFLFHARTGEAIQKCLERKGFPVTVLPVVISV